MHAEKEFLFLREVLEKCHVPLSVISPTDFAENLIVPGLSDFVRKTGGQTVRELFGPLESVTQYKFTDGFRCNYTFFLLSPKGEEMVWIGPYLSAPLSPEMLLEVGEMIGIAPHMQKYLNESYAAIPVIPENDSLFTLIDTFCEKLWQNPAFAIVDVSRQNSLPISPLHDIEKGESAEDIDARIAVMETRYAFENELMRTVAQGQQHKVEILLSSLGDHPFEMRAADPLRNSKNYSIIMNTLLRKAAEQGGVHPIYIDRVSAGFAEQIEKSTSLHESSELMKGMLTSYCRLVYKHSVQKYSPIVRKTILMIEADLAVDLTLHTLAAQQDISSGYLATVFKKETGKTVSEYVRDKRIRHAVYLLQNTNLQIQTVASHCGIMDVQYFSKIFKKLVGKTPKEYRASVHSKTTTPGKP